MKKNTHFVQLRILFLSLFLVTSYTLTAQVGIGNVDPTTTLDIDGSFSIRDGGLITLTAAAHNNLALPLTGGQVYSNYRINQSGAAGAFSIGSIVPIGASDGQTVTLQNTTTQTMVIVHNAGGAAANRILVPGEQDLWLSGRYTSVTLMYSDAQNRWIVQNKLSDETLWFTAPLTISAFTVNNLTITGVPSTSLSSVTVNLLGDWSVATQPTNDITIHHVEARTGEIRFVVENSALFTDYIGMDFVISIRNEL